MSDTTTTITPEERRMFREDASAILARDKNFDRRTAAEAILRLLTALEAAEAERDAALSRKDEAEASLAHAYNQISQQKVTQMALNAANHALANKAEQAEDETARLTAQLAALTGQQEDCKLHPCPYSREGLNCGVISLANNRAHEGMVENMRLNKMVEWLAAELSDGCSTSRCIYHGATESCPLECGEHSAGHWKEAARRAVE
ncbi:MAG: hypothetical protein AB7U63_10990 [Porticoccaceae bacterium]